MSVGRFLLQAAAGVGGAKNLIAIPHNNDGTANNYNLSLYEIDGAQFNLLDQIRARSSSLATYSRQVAFNPDPDTYGKIMAVSTNQGVAIIDYSNDTLTEVGTAGNNSKAGWGVAYSSDGSKLFTSGDQAQYIYRYDQATNGTLSNETQSSAFGVGERINMISIAKTKNVGIVCFNKGSFASIGAQTFTPSSFSLNDTHVTRTEEVLGISISPDGTKAVYVGKDAVVAPITSTGLLTIDASNNISGGTEQYAGAAPEGVNFAPNGNFVAIGANTTPPQALRVYNSTMTTLLEDVNPGGYPPYVVWDQNTEYLVAFRNGGNLRLYSWNGSNLLTLEHELTGLPNCPSQLQMASIIA